MKRFRLYSVGLRPLNFYAAVLVAFVCSQISFAFTQAGHSSSAVGHSIDHTTDPRARDHYKKGKDGKLRVILSLRVEITSTGSGKGRSFRLVDQKSVEGRIKPSHKVTDEDRPQDAVASEGDEEQITAVFYGPQVGTQKKIIFKMGFEDPLEQHLEAPVDESAQMQPIVVNSERAEVLLRAPFKEAIEEVVFKRKESDGKTVILGRLPLNVVPQ